MNDTIQPGRYRHFKGNMYWVYGIVEHTETGGQFALYKAMYGENKLWVRPLEHFTSNVIVDGKEVKRFTYLGD